MAVVLARMEERMITVFRIVEDTQKDVAAMAHRQAAQEDDITKLKVTGGKAVGVFTGVGLFIGAFASWLFGLATLSDK